MYDVQKKARTGTGTDLPDGAMGREYDFGAMLLDALEEAPERCAYRFQGAELTRGELRTEALGLADRLREAGLRPGAPAAVEIAHSLELAVAMCGVQIAGGCAIPIDPAVGAERRDAILADIRPDFAVTRGAPQNGTTRIAIDIERGTGEDAEQRDDYDPDLAFIVYTSGTSGGPKGVMIPHENYVRRMRHIVPSVTTNEGDMDLAWTPSSFITMVDELFLPLLCGVPSVIADPEIRTDPRAFKTLVQQEGVTTFRITPSLLNVVLRSGGAAEALSGVRMIICSGEAMPADLQRSVHRQLSACMLGFYGATEAPAAAKTVFDPDVPPVDTTICTRQPFISIRVVDEDGADAAIGETGEIWVGGCAVARGYYRRPELTAEKFIERDGERWYRTGDLGRQHEDDQVEILGRSDLSEVNIHGVRVSLPEIGDTLRATGQVDETWVSVVDPGTGRDPILVGHCVPTPGTAFDPEATRVQITGKLPTLAVPRTVIAHEHFPLTANGKVDVQQLLRDATAHVAAQATQNAKPQQVNGSATEIAVLNCFEQALGRRQLSINESFFDAGGTSLEAVTLAGFLSDHFGTEIGFEEIWLNPSIKGLSAFIETRGGESPARTFFHVEGVHGPNLIAIGFGIGHLAGMWPRHRLFVSPGIAGDPRISLRKRLDDYVAEYIDGLRRIQPTGPYQLIGFSLHGLLAYEIARRLHADGQEVTGIALVEPVTPKARRHRRSYITAAADVTLRNIAARHLGVTRNMLRLMRDTVISARVRPRSGQRNAYGHVVVAAEKLDPLPLPVDLIYCDSFAPEAVATWQEVAGENLRLRRVEAKDHQSLIQLDAIRQWKDVIDGWDR